MFIFLRTYNIQFGQCLGKKHKKPNIWSRSHTTFSHLNVTNIFLELFWKFTDLQSSLFLIFETGIIYNINR